MADALNRQPVPACDVLVIGAGIVGVATAYYLARQGAQVLVVERDNIGSGATGRNAGFVTSGTAVDYRTAVARYGVDTTHAVWQFTRENRRLLRDMLAEEGIDCDYREPGTLVLAGTMAELEALHQTHVTLSAAGIASEMLDRPALQARISVPLTSNVVGARFTPGDGALHSGRFLYGLAEAAWRHGARFRVGARAEPPMRCETGWDVALESSGETTHVTARTVVCATNVWLPDLVPEVAPAITAVRGQMLCTRPLPPIFPCGISSADGMQYWQQLPDGRVVLGGCRSAAQDQDVGYREPQLRSEIQDALTGYLQSVFAGLPSFEVEHRWAGIMAFSRDALPLIAPVPGRHGVFVAGGFTGHGMPFGLHAGYALAQACLSGVAPATLFPFRLGRPGLGMALVN
jgi:gamma-glutamylputrescine oxidase